MPVQWVIRPNPDFRGFAGTVASGTVRPGDRVVACPSERESTVERIVTRDGDLDAAIAGQSVTLVLADAIDVGRGDLLAGAANPPAATDQFAAHLLWMHEDPLLPERQYLLKIGTRLTTAQVTALRYRIDVGTLEHVAARTLALNEVGACNFALDEAIAFDPYREVRETGGFILIDRFTNATVGAGMIEFGLRRADNLARQSLDVGKAQRARHKGQRPCILWFTGLPASGKSTTANRVEKKLAAFGSHSYLLDGDNVRLGLNRDLGFTDADRVENIRRRCRGREALRRRRAHRARLVHLALSGRTPDGPRAGRGRRVRRDLRGHAARGVRSGAIPRASTGRPGPARSRTSPGSTPPTSHPIPRRSC